MKLQSNDLVFIIIMSFFTAAAILMFSSLLVIYDSSFYKSEFVKNGVYDKFGNKTFPDSSADNLIDYFRGRENLLGIYSGREIEHLDDVKILVNNLTKVFYFLLILLVIIISFLFYRKYKYLWLIFAASFMIIILFCILSYLFSLLNFSYLFDHFHRLFFTNDSWIFDGNSMLIRLFSQEFFIDAFTKILQYSFMLGAAGFLSAIFIRNRNLD